MKILFCLFLLIISLPLFSLNADDYWSNWHGPANGTACFTSGAPGASIVLSKTLDLTSLYGFSGLGSGILLRADNKTLYLKENRDYFAAPHILRGIDPYSGNTLWSSGKSALEDMSNPRGFQLFNDPRGHLSLHVPVYYEGYWNVYNLKTSAEEYLVSGSHACLGSRIIMDKWAWRNTQTTSTGGGMTWSHTGRLQYWNGAQYINTTLDPFQLIDHAWDNGRAVIFALKGYSYGALNASDTNAKEWQSARFMVLDSSGKVLSDTPVTDIHVPVSGCCCYFEGSMGGTADTADILMKLAVHGDYVYAIEHSTYEEKQLVRRSISGGFRKTDSIILGTDPLLSNLSYSISGNTLFLQGTDTLTAFSLDFKTIKWKQAIPHRTLYHIFVQGLTRVMSNGLKNRNLHSLATDANNVYSVSDSFLIVFNNSDGTELLRHRFTDIPNGGTAGSIILMPDFVAVTAAYISTKIWIFKNSAKSIASLEASADSLHVGQFNTVPLIVTAKDINGSESIVTTFCRYTIRDTSIIKCIGDSLLYGAYPGSTTVIASYWGHTDSFTIRVDTTALLPDSLNINKDTVTVMANDSSIIQATGYYHSASLLFTQTVNQLASWNSRSSSIATIINGIVKGVIHGTTQIVCSYKGKSDSCVIKVIPYVSFIRRINFGCATTQVKDGWISATNAAYSASTGFGWTTANGGCRSDRRDNILLKSFVLSSSATPSSWKIDLPDGAYRIRIAMGDNMYDTDATYSWTAAGSDTLIRHKGKTNTIADNHLTVSGGAGLSLTVKGAVNYIVIIADEGVSLADVADDYQTKDFTTGAQTYTLINQCEQSRLSLSPNPFNPTLFINLTVPAKESNYSLKVYSTNGTLIEDLSSFTSKGRLIWAPKTNSSAAYIIRLVNGTTAISRKVYLLK